MRKRRQLSRQVSDEKMSVNELLITHRNGFQMLSKRELVDSARMSMDDTCLRSMRQPVFRRHDLIMGFDMERGNLDQVSSSNAWYRGGA
jgi:hypothetical protein